MKKNESPTSSDQRIETKMALIRQAQRRQCTTSIKQSPDLNDIQLWWVNTKFKFKCRIYFIKDYLAKAATVAYNTLNPSCTKKMYFFSIFCK